MRSLPHRSAHDTGPRDAIVFIIALFATLFAATGLLTVAAKADGAAARNGLVTLDDVQSGTLLLKSKEPGKYVPAPLLATDAKIEVTGPMARARVTQRFINPGDGWVEGKYVFPLPEDAAVDTMKMIIGDRVIEGQIKEKEEARRIYEKAKAEGKKAGLLEQQRPNVFTNAVANIGPHESVTIQIEYQQTVHRDGDRFSLRFPMVVAPRYVPKEAAEPQVVDFAPGSGWGTTQPDQSDLPPGTAHPGNATDLTQPPVLDPEDGKVNPVALEVSLEAGFPLGPVKSSFHKVDIQRTGKEGAKLSLAEKVVPADKDFELTWEPAETATPTAGLFRETVDGEDYVLVMLMPPSGAAQPQAKPREAIFVIDNSGSMAGASMPQAKAGLLFALDKLKPEDSFNIIRFDDTHELLFPQPVRADRENIAVARKFVNGLNADGGTEMLPALKAALNDRTPDDASRVRQVIFLTDGAISNEKALFEEIARHRGRSRLFTVGIGSAPNSYFMTRATEAGRGSFTHIGDLAQVKSRMAELVNKLEHPLVTNVTATWPEGTQTESWPDPVPDLYKGEPVVLAARMDKARGDLTLKGDLAGKAWEVRIPLDAGETRPGIGKLWARRKIAALEADRLMGGDYEKTDARILKVALAHHLVSRRTSLVAVDVTPTRPNGEPLESRDMPVNLPDGWEFDKVFGESAPAPAMRKAMRAAPTAMLASAQSPIADTAQDRGLALPQTASDAPGLIRNGLFTLLAAFLLMLLWRRITRQG